MFGCKAHVQIPKKNRRGKFQDTAWSGTMVGYSTNSPEWVILDSRTNTLRKAYSVTFNETESAFQANKQVYKELNPLWSDLANCNLEEDQSTKDINTTDDYIPHKKQPKPKGNDNQELQLHSDAENKCTSSTNDTDTHEPKEDEISTPNDMGTRVQQHQLIHLGMCMALKTSDKLPTTWKQALHKPY